jgi:hypothetical protein
MKMDRDDITVRLECLGLNDRRRELFGSVAHNYILNPPLDGAEIEAFEIEHGIRLPEDYRFFITEIGNGGAGPAYGLFPFACFEEGRRLSEYVEDLGKPFSHVEAWNLDRDFGKRAPEILEGTPK